MVITESWERPLKNSELIRSGLGDRFDFARSGVMLAATESCGLWRSTDRGSTWSAVTELGHQSITAIAFDASSPRCVGVSSAGLGVSPDGSHTWCTPRSLPGLGLSVACVDDGGRQRDLVPAGLLHAGLVYSTDSGATWLRSEHAPSANLLTQVVCSPAIARDRTLYAAGRLGRTRFARRESHLAKRRRRYHGNARLEPGPLIRDRPDALRGHAPRPVREREPGPRLEAGRRFPARVTCRGGGTWSACAGGRRWAGGAVARRRLHMECVERPFRYGGGQQLRLSYTGRRAPGCPGGDMLGSPASSRGVVFAGWR